tara:strand:- start:50 stop:565 length:516 start_codon:yes stop_codon:yes gene_type:complete
MGSHQSTATQNLPSTALPQFSTISILSNRILDLEKQNAILAHNLDQADSLIIEMENHTTPPTPSPRDSSFDYQTYFFSQDYFLPNHEITVPIILPPNLVDSLSCPITHEIIHDPWIDYEGNTYEKTAILEHLKKSKTSPITRNPLDATPQFLFPNRQLYNIIQSLRNDNIK